MATDTTPQNVAQAVTEISERMTLLVHEEIELAKAEVTEKVTSLLKGVAVAAAAGVFVVIGLGLGLQGLAWFAWFALPVGITQYFWGFFLVAGLLFIIGGICGYLAAKVFKESSPPTPDMAIDEAGKIKKTLMFRRKKKG